MTRMTTWWGKTKTHNWLNKEFQTLVKHMLLAFGFIIFTLISFYVLNSSQKAQACRDRNASRLELRVTLLYIVDLSDLLSDSPVVLEYTKNRSDYINSNPALEPIEC